MAEPASQEYLLADQQDAHLALTQAVAFLSAALESGPMIHKELSEYVVHYANSFYNFLRNRESLAPARIILSASAPASQGE